MKIKFIKDHPAGIKKGRETNAADAWAASMIDQGYAEEVTDNPIKKEKKEVLKTKDKK
jgi:hypothetical protein